MKHNPDTKHDARISEIIDKAKRCPDHLHINVFDEGNSMISMYCSAVAEFCFLSIYLFIFSFIFFATEEPKLDGTP